MMTNILNINKNDVSFDNLATKDFAKIVKLRKSNLAKMFDSYYETPHRLSEIAIIRGVHFIDDTSSININRTWFSMEKISMPIIWIVPCEAMNNNLEAITDTVNEKVKIIVTYGQNSVITTFNGVVKTVINEASLEEAIKTAYMYALEDDAIVFSPSTGNLEDVSFKAWTFINTVKEL